MIQGNIDKEKEEEERKRKEKEAEEEKKKNKGKKGKNQGKKGKEEDVKMEEEPEREPAEPVFIMVSDVEPSPVADPRTDDDELPVSEGRWKVTTVTGDVDDAGAGDDVILVLCGELGESQPLVLEEKDHMDPGDEDEFEMNVEDDIGDLYKIRLGFEDTKKDADWFVKEIKLQDQDTLDEFTIEINDRIRADEEHDGWREFPVPWPAVMHRPVVKYTSQVYTGDVENAGTDATVMFNVFGKFGSTGKRQLKYGLNNANKFEKGHMDIFEFEAVKMWNLERAIIAHDGAGPGAGWFLDKIVVNDEQRDFVFENNRWLDEEEDDGKLERELIASEPLPPGIKVYVSTAEGSEQLEDTQIILVIYGEDGKSHDILLTSDKGNLYQPGCTDEFKVSAEEVGEVGLPYKVRVGFAPETEGDKQWLLQSIRIKADDSKEEFLFELNDKIVLNEETDSWREIPLNKPKEEEEDGKDDEKDDTDKEGAKDDKEQQKGGKDKKEENDNKDGEAKEDEQKDTVADDDTLKVYNYLVEVYTGDETGAGTDAHVYLEIQGERGDTGKRALKHRQGGGNKFESGKVDEFVIEAVDLLDLERLVVGHDGNGAGSGWYLDKVVITRQAEEAKAKYMFPCNRWLDEGEDDGKLERILECAERVREGDWKVSITTSKKKDAGTDATIYLTVFGDKGATEREKLETKDNKKPEPGKTCEYVVLAEPPKVGKITKIRLEHDNVSQPNGENSNNNSNKDNNKAGWHVEKIVMEDLWEGKDELQFPVARWLSAEEDDGDVVRELPARWPDQEPLPVTKYTVQTFTKEGFESDSPPEVYVTLVGPSGDSGKRFLRKSNNKKIFQSGAVDTFSIEAIGIGKLRKLKLGHTAEDADGFHLEKVTVKESDGKKELVFNCGRWLKEGEGDGETEVVLLLEEGDADEDDDIPEAVAPETAPPEEEGKADDPQHEEKIDEGPTEEPNQSSDEPTEEPTEAPEEPKEKPEEAPEESKEPNETEESKEEPNEETNEASEEPKGESMEEPKEKADDTPDKPDKDTSKEEPTEEKDETKDEETPTEDASEEPQQNPEEPKEHPEEPKDEAEEKKDDENESNDKKDAEEPKSDDPTEGNKDEEKAPEDEKKEEQPEEPKSDGEEKKEDDKKEDDKPEDEEKKNDKQDGTNENDDDKKETEDKKDEKENDKKEDKTEDEKKDEDA